jgi:hypothetical protein
VTGESKSGDERRAVTVGLDKLDRRVNIDRRCGRVEIR